MCLSLSLVYIKGHHSVFHSWLTNRHRHSRTDKGLQTQLACQEHILSRKKTQMQARTTEMQSTTIGCHAIVKSAFVYCTYLPKIESSVETRQGQKLQRKGSNHEGKGRTQDSSHKEAVKKGQQRSRHFALLNAQFAALPAVCAAVSLISGMMLPDDWRRQTEQPIRKPHLRKRKKQ